MRQARPTSRRILPLLPTAHKRSLLARMSRCASQPNCLHHGPPAAVDEGSLSASRAAAWRRLRERWGWLDGLGDVDRSWIYWGAFHAYQQEGWALLRSWLGTSCCDDASLKRHADWFAGQCKIPGTHSTGPVMGGTMSLTIACMHTPRCCRRYDQAWKALHKGNSLQVGWIALHYYCLCRSYCAAPPLCHSHYQLPNSATAQHGRAARQQNTCRAALLTASPCDPWPHHAIHTLAALQDAAQPYDPQQDEVLTQSIMNMFQVWVSMTANGKPCLPGQQLVCIAVCRGLEHWPAASRLRALPSTVLPSSALPSNPLPSRVLLN